MVFTGWTWWYASVNGSWMRRHAADASHTLFTAIEFWIVCVRVRVHVRKRHWRVLFTRWSVKRICVSVHSWEYEHIFIFFFSFFALVLHVVSIFQHESALEFALMRTYLNLYSRSWCLTTIFFSFFVNTHAAFSTELSVFLGVFFVTSFGFPAPTDSSLQGDHKHGGGGWGSRLNLEMPRS